MPYAHEDPVATVGSFLRLAQKARHGGLLSLEGELDAIADGLARHGLRRVVDGEDPEASASRWRRGPRARSPR